MPQTRLRTVSASGIAGVVNGPKPRLAKADALGSIPKFVPERVVDGEQLGPAKEPAVRQRGARP